MIQIKLVLIVLAKYKKKHNYFYLFTFRLVFTNPSPLKSFFIGRNNLKWLIAKFEILAKNSSLLNANKSKWFWIFSGKNGNAVMEIPKIELICGAINAWWWNDLAQSQLNSFGLIKVGMVFMPLLTQIIANLDTWRCIVLDYFDNQ